MPFQRCLRGLPFHPWAYGFLFQPITSIIVYGPSYFGPNNWSSFLRLWQKLFLIPSPLLWTFFFLRTLELKYLSMFFFLIYNELNLKVFSLSLYKVRFVLIASSFYSSSYPILFIELISTSTGTMASIP